MVKKICSFCNENLLYIPFNCKWDVYCEDCRDQLGKSFIHNTKYGFWTESSLKNPLYIHTINKGESDDVEILDDNDSDDGFDEFK